MYLHMSDIWNTIYNINLINNMNDLSFQYKKTDKAPQELILHPQLSTLSFYKYFPNLTFSTH